ncbi:hypothetical protein K440DRAFT_637320, partial [Wilcoxina mikolae CBS 423.85]
MIDGSSPPSSRMTHSCALQIRIRDTTYRVNRLVTWLDPAHPIVLGMAFIKEHIPSFMSGVGDLGSPVAASSLLPNVPATTTPSVIRPVVHLAEPTPVRPTAASGNAAFLPTPSSSPPQVASNRPRPASIEHEDTNITYAVSPPGLVNHHTVSPASVPELVPCSFVEMDNYDNVTLACHEASFYFSDIPPAPAVIAFAASTISDPTIFFPAAVNGRGETNHFALAAAVDAENVRPHNNHLRISASTAETVKYNNAVLEQFLLDKEESLFLDTIRASLPVIPGVYSDFQDIFDLDYTKSPPVLSHGVECVIANNTSLPPPATPYPLGVKDRAEELKQITELRALTRVSPSSCFTAAPAFFVNK